MKARIIAIVNEKKVRIKVFYNSLLRGANDGTYNDNNTQNRKCKSL